LLGLVFLRYVCASFEELHRQLAARHGAGAERKAAKTTKPGETFNTAKKTSPDPELPATYREAGVFFVPAAARWERVFPLAGEPAAAGPAAVRAIEDENPALRGVFPPALARSARAGEPGAPNSFTRLLGGLSAREAALAFSLVLDHYARIAPGAPLTAPGGTQTPKPLVELIAAMLEPYKGRFCDPCCGGGDLLAGVADFVTRRQGKLTDLAFYAQERNTEAWRLAKMNLIVRGVDTAQILLNAESPLRRDLHRDLKFDFLAAIPPFQDTSPFIQHVLARLSPTGLGVIVLSRKTSPGEREIRRVLVDGHLLDCVVNLPPGLFSRPGLCLWFLSPGKTARGRRSDEVLFIDARSRWDPGLIARTYHNWRFPKGSPYRDTSLFAISANTARIREAGYNLNPGFYLGLPETADDASPEDHLAGLRAELEALVKEEARLNRQLVGTLRKIRFDA
jgi:type I restriction enzyme M protein